MELERDQHIGAPPYERSVSQGYKLHQLYSQVGTLHLRVPQTRDGEFHPSILQRHQRSEKALVTALVEAYVQGVSTLKMAKVTEQLLAKQFSASTISRFSEQLDAELEAWPSRPLTQDFVYFPLGAVPSRRDHRRNGRTGGYWRS
ncbi:transposase [Fodinibius halophilus]|uniref:Mutator family transposase n=1 Tax=Fodinibius halophilus TaxID=1736908 RepID=A0A6M1TH30_9BACT|nr:transposase [Fodinibius halophilus]NGP90074.1 hypothetical protein [Fodinibius halophilus]